MHWLLALTLLTQDPKAGDKSVVTFESTMELETVVRDGKGEATHRLNLSRREKFNQVWMDSKTVRVECVSSTLQKSGTDTPAEQKATPLAGNAYFASRADSGWSAKDLDGRAPPAEGANLGAWNDIAVLLPPGGAEPKSGDKWVLEGKDLLPVLFPTSLREGTAKFECSCESADGGKANIVFTGSISGRSRDEAQTQVNVVVKAGRLTYDLQRKRPASLFLSGSFESAADMMELTRKPGTGASVNNEEERHKIGEISVKSLKLEVAIGFE